LVKTLAKLKNEKIIHNAFVEGRAIHTDSRANDSGVLYENAECTTKREWTWLSTIYSFMQTI